MRVEGEGGGRRAEEGGLMLEGGGLKVKGGNSICKHFFKIN